MIECPVNYALSILSGKWKLYIVWLLTQEKVIRFNEMQRRADGISAIMLSKCLQELENDKIIIRKDYHENPPKVEYTLSDLGIALEPALLSLGKWGELAYKVLSTSKKNTSGHT